MDALIWEHINQCEQVNSEEGINFLVEMLFIFNRGVREGFISPAPLIKAKRSALLRRRGSYRGAGGGYRRFLVRGEVFKEFRYRQSPKLTQAALARILAVQTGVINLIEQNKGPLRWPSIIGFHDLSELSLESVLLNESDVSEIWELYEKDPYAVPTIPKT